MGICWKAVVDVFGDTVVCRTRLIQRVDVHTDLTEKAHVVEELMADLCGHRITLGHRQPWADRNTHFCLEVMAHPAGLPLRHICPCNLSSRTSPSGRYRSSSRLTSYVRQASHDTSMG
jgi:hypothetical protein